MRTILVGGKRFNSVTGTFEANGSLVLEGGRITAVDSAGAHGDTDEVIDCTGMTIIPGLINLHGHLAWDGFSDLEKQTRFDGPMGFIKVARGLKAAVEAGFTRFRDLGCVHDTGLIARQAVQDGLLAGPVVYACGRAICRTGGHIWWGNREADGPDDVRRAVREQVRAGADWIKLMAHGYTYAEVEAAVETAHAEGVPITTDAGTEVNLTVRAGVDCIEHGGDYSDALIAEIVEKGIWIVPTLSPVVMQARFGHEWGMKSSVIARRRRQLEQGGRYAGLVRARKAGARMAFGTDSGSPVVPHDTVLPEVQALLEFGILETPSQVLQAATIHAAQCLRIDHLTGSLTEGKAADLVVLDGDLEASLEVIRRVDRVWVEGRPVVTGGRAYTPDPRGFQEFVQVGA